MLFIAFVIPSMMPFMPVMVPAMRPKTMPGITNRKKISDTIDCMIGAPKEASAPSASRQGESAGISVIVRMIRPMTIDARAQPSPRRSSAVIGCSCGRSSWSPSMAMAFTRGSMTLSVRYQPRIVISIEEAVVKK